MMDMLAHPHDFLGAPPALSIVCAGCQLKPVFFPQADAHASTTEHTVTHQMLTLKAKQKLCVPPTPPNTFYALHAGTLKSILAVGGQDCIIDFHYTGELIALHALAPTPQAVIYEALNDCAICVTHLNEHSSAKPHQHAPLQHHTLLWQQMGACISQYQQQYVWRSHLPALPRFIRFLLQTQVRQKSENPYLISLPMTRSDIANHLGLTLETVCRLLADLRLRKVIEIQTRQLHILQPTQFAALSRVASD